MAKEEWRNGWRSLVSATAGISVASFAASSTGIVMEPLNRLYGWPKSVVSAGVLCVAIITLLLAPLNGHLIRNHGPRRVALASLIAAAIGFCCIAMSGGQAWTWWLAWFVFGALTAGVGPIVWTSGITLAFDRHRGAALSIALSGSGLAFFLSPLIGFWLLNNFGWRFVYVGFAVMVIGVHLPLTWFWFRPLSPQGRNSAATDTASGGTSAGLTFVEIVTNPKFVMLALFTMLVASTEGAFMIHLVPILRHTGLAAGQAAEIASILGVAMIIGRLGTGFLFDHWSPIATVVIMVSGLLLSCLVAILLQ